MLEDNNEILFVKVLFKPQGITQIEHFYYYDTLLKKAGDRSKMLLIDLHLASFIVLALKGLTLCSSGKTQLSREIYLRVMDSQDFFLGYSDIFPFCIF
jgi:hypothetical protein